MATHLRQHHRAVILAIMSGLFGQLQCDIPVTEIDRNNPPCSFLDSLNITGLQMDTNDDGTGAVLTLDNHRYTAEMVGDFDYEILQDALRQPAAVHQRACVCLDRPCVRLMCPRGMNYSEEMDECISDQRLCDVDISVRLANGSIQIQNLFQNFGYTLGWVCDALMELDADRYEDDAWELHENGSITTLAGAVLSQHDYNLMPFVNETSMQVEYKVMYCFARDNSNDYIFYHIEIGSFLSVPFLIITLCVFIILPELRNLHGKSVMSYLASLAVATTLVIYRPYVWDVNSSWCQPFGYSVYFSILSTFNWLNVISYDLWWHFRGIQGTRKVNEKRVFRLYSAYAWGLAVIMVLLCYIMDNIIFVPDDLRPGFSAVCYFRTDRLIEFFYIYLPVMLFFFANGVFFTMTALQIRRVQNDMRRVTSDEDRCGHTTRLEQAKEKYGLLLRLSIVMGVPWFMVIEVVAWVAFPKGMLWATMIVDVTSCVQGVVIFVLFVVKPKVKKLLAKRCRRSLGYRWRSGRR